MSKDVRKPSDVTETDEYLYFVTYDPYVSQTCVIFASFTHDSLLRSDCVHRFASLFQLLLLFQGNRKLYAENIYVHMQ